MCGHEEGGDPAGGRAPDSDSESVIKLCFFVKPYQR